VFAGTVDVRGRRPIVEQPFGVVEEASGTILVADSRAGIVYRLDPRRREGTIVARIPAPAI
jgi:hypothetical protein